jgi:hypothetical protein
MGEINSTNVRFCQTAPQSIPQQYLMSMDLLPNQTIPQNELQQLRQVLERLRTLGDLLEWGRGLTPPVASPIVVTQDEYTHDVLIPYGAGRWLDFDTT